MGAPVAMDIETVGQLKTALKQLPDATPMKIAMIPIGGTHSAKSATFGMVDGTAVLTLKN